MTDSGAAFQPGQGELPRRPRGAYVGHEVFGHGDGAVLVEPEVARDLRAAAELASQERRIAGGLLYGRGRGAGAGLGEPGVAGDRRAAAERGSQERRIAGGLLYGRGLADDEGRYLVVDGFLEAGPGESDGGHVSRDGHDSFALSDADLGLLREDAARMYAAAVEV